jgi:coiled-coil domain-containing protein 55
LTSFYQSMLDDSEAKHAAAVASTSGMVDSGPSLAIRPPTQRDQDVDDEAEYDPFLARESASSSRPAGPPKLVDDTDDKPKLPKGVEMNDDGEIIDKRTLLKAGLNVTKKPVAVLPDSLKTGFKNTTQPEGPWQSRAVGTAASHRERMARERKRLEEQLAAEEVKKQRDEEERIRLEEEEARRRREGDDGQAEKKRLEAKERFLARKRAREGGEGSNKKAKE